MNAYEKLGVFYLGREVDPASGARTDRPLLYDSTDLVTHAVIVGMTGSGKTGLGIALLEEAAMDRVPVIALDPKGDLGNLLLTFPALAPADFRPWIDETAAAAAARSADDEAANVAKTWREGLASWEQDGDRIRRLREAADFAIFTPGGTAGLPIALLRSLAAPPAAARADEESLRDRIESTVGGLLFLLGIEADPAQSREHILLSTLLDQAWREGRSLDLASLIREIQTPPVQRVGVLDLESFFPQGDRFALAMRVNNLLASPGFAAWRDGDPLDVDTLLRAPDGKPRVSVVSLAHLDDAQRMFFVTVLLGEIVSWMRALPGTSSLRAVLLMDEVFGFLPPTANPPSKKPLLTLLKQARAYGLGVVVATQNPVDLDYKALSNAGSWFLGRLQTERDVLRVLDGLEGASAAGGASFDRARTQAVISGLAKRRFYLHDVHHDAPALFETRWTMSYLAGPLTRVQIDRLMAPRKGGAAVSPAAAVTAAPAASPAPTAAPAPSAAAARRASSGPSTSDRPVLPPGVSEGFVPSASGAGGLVYRPSLLGVASLHFVDAKSGVDVWDDRAWLASIDEESADPWESADATTMGAKDLAKTPEGAAAFDALPAAATRPASYEAWGRALAARVYRDASLTLLRCDDLGETSKPGEAEGTFRGRLAQKKREERDAAAEKLKAKYAAKVATLTERVRRDEQRVEKEKAQQTQQSFQTAVAVGATVLGALLGTRSRSMGTIGRASTALRSAGRVAREGEDVRAAGDTLAADQAALAELERQLQTELDALNVDLDPSTLALTQVPVKPRKADTRVQGVWLAWLPWRSGAGGALQPDSRTTSASNP
ncbi:MAG: DUF87 domain-containing protein [bacterium]